MAIPRVVDGLTTNYLTKREKQRMERRSQLIRMYENGSTVADIAVALDVSKQNIYEMLARLDLPTPTERDAS